jgi:predicted aspartyl protease
METTMMGKVTVKAKLESLEDVFNQSKGNLRADQVRGVEVTDALIDTGASGLFAPRRLIAQLGVLPYKKQVVKTANGDMEVEVYRAVRLSVQGRDCISDVTAIADNRPVIIGQLPLEAMDWVVDLKNQRLIGNPEHGGVEMAECYGDY